MRIPTEEDLSKFKKESFRNSVRLFRDACLLYENKRYPTAYSIGVLSYEELGKTLSIDRVCDLMCLNPEFREQIYKDYFEGIFYTTIATNSEEQILILFCFLKKKNQQNHNSFKMAG